MLVIMMYFFFVGHMITKLIPIFDLKENLFGKELVHKVSKETEIEAINVLLGMLWANRALFILRKIPLSPQ